MKIKANEYLQVGYDPITFQRMSKVNKTAVDPNPQQNQYWQSKGLQYHHIFVEPFIEFARYIPNKYDIIHFTRGATDYELKLAKKLLNKGGEIIC